MPGVTCGECGAGTNVSFRRGTRLADLGCPACGKTALHLSSKGQANRNAGRKYENCACCGRRSLRHLHPSFEWEGKFSESGPFPAGSPACQAEEPVPTTRTRHSTIHVGLVERFGKRDGWISDAAEAELKATARPVPESCAICGHEGYDSMYGRSAAYYVSGYAFERGDALVAVCDNCGHTILLVAAGHASPQTAASRDTRITITTTT